MADTDKLVEQLSGLSVLEIAGLVKQLEEKWGVSAAAPVAMAAGPAAARRSWRSGSSGGGRENHIRSDPEGNGREQDCRDQGSSRCGAGLGLAEAKALVEGAPKTIKEGVTKQEADEIKKKIEAAGAKVEIK